MMVVGACVVSAQADTRPSYVVASVKPNTSGAGDSSTHGSRGQVIFTNQTLKRFIERAYNVKPIQVTGPDWMESVRFDIAAKYPPDTKPDDRSLMLRSLLEDRFKLVVHREQKEKSGFALVVAKGGFKLKPVEAGSSSTNSDGGRRLQTLTATKTSMAQLADFVARVLEEIVVDKTGISGVYDFKLRWTNDDQNPDGPDSGPVPTLHTVLQEVLGLRLQAQKVPVEIIVVDHVERIPIEN